MSSRACNIISNFDSDKANLLLLANESGIMITAAHLKLLRSSWVLESSLLQRDANGVVLRSPGKCRIRRCKVWPSSSLKQKEGVLGMLPSPRSASVAIREGRLAVSEGNTMRRAGGDEVGHELSSMPNISVASMPIATG
jgi:hypothetical protein